ncbi:helix-turn-helix domain-containing protein [Streptomyces sp. NPDC020807]|uniref:helix-turn-helix domain-containing protein n=1 Tax=Streptomyces sp. NPDC020807 TaxID=3155119 RepID=UPI0033CA0BCF
MTEVITTAAAAVPEQNHANPDPLLSIEGAAAYLAVPTRMMRRLRAERTIPAVKVGRHVRFRVSALEAYLTEQTVPARREVRR